MTTSTLATPSNTAGPVASGPLTAAAGALYSFTACALAAGFFAAVLVLVILFGTAAFFGRATAALVSRP